MANAPQKINDMPSYQASASRAPAQCPGCPPGNSLPIVPNEDTCWDHGWWHAQNYS